MGALPGPPDPPGEGCGWGTPPGRGAGGVPEEAILPKEGARGGEDPQAVVSDTPPRATVPPPGLVGQPMSPSLGTCCAPCPFGDQPCTLLPPTAPSPPGERRAGCCRGFIAMRVTVPCPGERDPIGVLIWGEVVHQQGWGLLRRHRSPKPLPGPQQGVGGGMRCRAVPCRAGRSRRAGTGLGAAAPPHAAPRAQHARGRWGTRT